MRLLAVLLAVLVISTLLLRAVAALVVLHAHITPRACCARCD